MNEAVIEAGESGAEATGWTQKDFLKLLAALKDALPEDDETRPYKTGLKAVDWDKVAFPPFSAGECQEKWKSFMWTMRKYRTLPEVLDEAQDLLSNPFCDKNIHPDFPKPPKPPKLAYIRRCMSWCARKNPGANVVLMTKAFSEEYEKLSDITKANYAKKYRLALKEYSRKMQTFCIKNNLRVRMKERKKKKKKKKKTVFLEYEGECKDEDFSVKPPGNGFRLFILENSARGRRGEPLHGASFLRVMSQRWKELSENEKQKYNKRCAEMKREYEAKLIQYLDRLDEEEKQQFIKEKGINISKKTLDRHKMHPSEPEMPSQSVFRYFHTDMLKHAEESMSRKELSAKAAEEWHRLSDTERNRYAEIIEENTRKYAEELQAWFQTLSQEQQRDYLKKKPDKIIFLQKYIDVTGESLKPSSDEKTNAMKVEKRAKKAATRASTRLRAKKDLQA